MFLSMRCIGLLVLVCLAGGCDRQRVADQLRRTLSKTLLNKKIEISPADYWHSTVVCTEPSFLTLEIDVTAGESVNVDLLDPSEFNRWKKSLSLGSYSYYKSFRGESVLRETFVGKIRAGSYVVLIRTSKGIFGKSSRVSTRLRSMALP